MVAGFQEEMSQERGRRNCYLCKASAQILAPVSFCFILFATDPRLRSDDIETPLVNMRSVKEFKVHFVKTLMR